MSETTGLTKDAGWELGARRTFPVSAEAAWRYLTGEGLAGWLGRTDLPTEVGAEYTTREGTTGQIRGYAPGRRIRLTWTPRGSRPSTLQVTVIPARTGATIAIHQERLRDATERAELLQHWHGVLDEMARHLGSPSARR